jgi:hypothetical protein
MTSSRSSCSTPTLNVVLRLRKLRNRLSQRAFRLRQANKIKDLHERAEISQSQDVNREQFLALQQENGRLREHIKFLQAQTDEIQASLRSTSLSTSQILESGKSPQALLTASNTCDHVQNSEPSAPPRLATDVSENYRGNHMAESNDADDVVYLHGTPVGFTGSSRPCDNPNPAVNSRPTQRLAAIFQQ